MMLTSQFLLAAFLVGFLENNLYKISETASASYGTPPDERTIGQLLDSSIVIINKQGL